MELHHKAGRLQALHSDFAGTQRWSGVGPDVLSFLTIVDLQQ